MERLGALSIRNCGFLSREGEGQCRCDRRNQTMPMAKGGLGCKRWGRRVAGKEGSPQSGGWGGCSKGGEGWA